MNNYSLYHISDANTPNLMEGYVGITSNTVSKRFIGHKSKARRGVHTNKNLAEFLNNNPEATVTVLQENLTKAEAERLEHLLRPIPKVGLNVVLGGCSSKAFSGSNHPMFGKTRSEETKAKISAKLKKVCEDPEYKVRVSGKNLSDETRAKMSVARAGKNNPQAKVANIYQNGTDELIAEGINIAEWARLNGYSQSPLSATAYSDRSKAHHWKTNRHHTNGIYARYVEAL